MKAISSADKANVISLLLSGHSIRKAESITSLGKSTVGRIYQELEMDKENHKGGRPSKLSPTSVFWARVGLESPGSGAWEGSGLSNPKPRPVGVRTD
jgi:transposase